MKIFAEELFKIKESLRDTFKLKVYASYPKAHYSGEAFVYAKDAEDANVLLDDFIKSDPKNFKDSWGYTRISEEDYTGEITDEDRQITGGIYYSG